MKIARTPDELRSHHPGFQTRYVLVPTMGALHDGHFALINMARSLAGPKGMVAVSLFVNPIQFDNPNDLDAYPSTLEADLAACERLGVDLVFTPEASSLYHSDRSITVTESSLSGQLCGATRPGHFDGVCTVVSKLFNLFQASDAVFGKKDYQQLAIIRRMVRDLNFPITLHGVETVREPNGLALSSRNVRLTPEQRSDASVIQTALQEARKHLLEGTSDSTTLCSLAESMILANPSRPTIDYLTIVDAETLQPVSRITGDCVLATAVFFGDVRLIDNIELAPSH